MRNRKQTFTLLGILALLFFVSQLLFSPKAYLVSRLGQAFQAPVVFFRSLTTRAALMADITELMLENQSLQAKLGRLHNGPALFDQERQMYVRAPIYSTYPFNTHGDILVAIGKESTVAIGAAAFVAPDIFIGQVVSVANGKAIIRTIFDPGWELPVKIGEGKVDALLIGGQEPRLTLVSKRKPLIGGEPVLLASKDFSYGLLLGSIAELRQSKESLFLEGKLTTPYLLSDVAELYIAL